MIGEVIEMELLSSMMLLALYIWGRFMIWDVVGKTEIRKQVKVRGRIQYSAAKFDIRSCPSVAKRV